MTISRVMKGNLNGRPFPTYQYGDRVWMRGKFVPTGSTDYVTIYVPGRIGFVYTVNDMYRVELESGGSVQTYAEALKERV